MEGAPLDRLQVSRVDIALQHRATHGVTEFVQRSSRVTQVSREVFVGFTGEALGYVSTNRIRRVVGLPLRPDVACESWSRCERENFLPDLIRDFPHE